MYICMYMCTSYRMEDRGTEVQFHVVKNLREEWRLLGCYAVWLL
jgi:hypothetical protein